MPPNKSSRCALETQGLFSDLGKRLLKSRNMHGLMRAMLSDVVLTSLISQEAFTETLGQKDALNLITCKIARQWWLGFIEVHMSGVQRASCNARPPIRF